MSHQTKETFNSPEMMVISSVTARDQTIVSLFFSVLPVVILAVGWPERFGKKTLIATVKTTADRK